MMRRKALSSRPSIRLGTRVAFWYNYLFLELGGLSGIAVALAEPREGTSDMFRSSYKVATIWGIPIKLHISLPLVLPFLAMHFGLLNAVLLEIGLATSIVLHELGHSLVAINKGCRVREITLLFIGGAAQMEQIPRRPRDEILMAAAGPTVSIVLGGALVLIGPRLPLPPIKPWSFNLVELCGVFNITLTIFNLLPSFPMDGGRILRAVLTPKLGRLRATFIAARLGKIMAILFGVYGMLSSPPRYSLIAIAFFIFIAASNEYRIVRMQETESGQGFGRWPPVPPPWHGETRGKAIIGPPPYERGGESRADIEVSDDEK